MDFVILLGIALGLAMDAFSVAIGVSVALGGTSGRQTFRLAWHFGLFQALMPIIGWAAGSSIRPLIEDWDHWIALVLLSLVGGRMILDAVRTKARGPRPRDPTRGWSLVMLSIATSIDALAVGLSFAAIGVDVWFPAAIIGVTAGAMTLLGSVGGRALGTQLGARMAVAGGFILIVIGIWIVLEHVVFA